MQPSGTLTLEEYRMLPETEPATEYVEGEMRQNAQMPLQIGPLGMRLGLERDPHLRELSDQEGVKQGLALMAFSLDRLWEAVAIELGTHDERQIAREVKRLLVKFSRADVRWGELKSPK